MREHDEELIDALWIVTEYMEGFSDDAEFMGETREEGYARFKEKQEMLFLVDKIGIENITEEMRESIVWMVRDGFDFLDSFSGADDPFADEDEESIDDLIDKVSEVLSKFR